MVRSDQDGAFMEDSDCDSQHRTAFPRNTFTSVIAVHMMRFSFLGKPPPPATPATCSQRLAISPTSNRNPPLLGGFLRLDLLPEVVQKNMEVSKLRDAGVRDALPWETGHRKLWSLAEMINYVTLYTGMLMEQFARAIDRLYGLQQRDIQTLPDHEKHVLYHGVLKLALEEIDRLGLSSHLRTKVTGTQFQMMPGNYVSTAAVTRELELLHSDIMSELAGRKFAYIPPPNDKFFEQEQLFGEEVHSKLPSARVDIKDAGNCLAASLDTAAVFHLMRVAEHGLRALANRLRVTLKHKGQACPLELADWEQVITEIKNKIAVVRQLPKGSKQRKDKLELFSDAADHCTFMKDIWRNNTSHTRKPYKQSEAIGILERVQDFMEFLGRAL
jgi:hypothetical protein